MAETSREDLSDLIVYFNGDFVLWGEARVHVFSPAVKYGAGVFEGIRGYWSDGQDRMNIFRLRDHLLRMEFSQKVMRYERIVTADELHELTVEVVRRNAFRESVHIRPSVFIEGYGEMTAPGPVGCAITAVPRGTPGWVEHGCRVQVSSWQRISDRSMPARVKAHANYNNSRLAAGQAKLDGYDTALMLNRHGHVSEGPGMCFFMIRDGVPVTPGVTSDILESITRATVIDLLRERSNRETLERDLDRSELYAAEEAFFCGTGWEITPIIEIDGLAVGDGQVGPVTKALQKAYFDLVTGAVPGPQGWLTPV